MEVRLMATARGILDRSGNGSTCDAVDGRRSHFFLNGHALLQWETLTFLHRVQNDASNARFDSALTSSNALESQGDTSRPGMKQKQ